MKKLLITILFSLLASSAYAADVQDWLGDINQFEIVRRNLKNGVQTDWRREKVLDERTNTMREAMVMILTRESAHKLVEQKFTYFKIATGKKSRCQNGWELRYVEGRSCILRDLWDSGELKPYCESESMYMPAERDFFEMCVDVIDPLIV